jgi:hypothetical protein
VDQLTLTCECGVVIDGQVDTEGCKGGGEEVRERVLKIKEKIVSVRGREEKRKRR